MAEKELSRWEKLDQAHQQFQSPISSQAVRMAAPEAFSPETDETEIRTVDQEETNGS